MFFFRPVESHSDSNPETLLFLFHSDPIKEQDLSFPCKFLVIPSMYIIFFFVSTELLRGLNPIKLVVYIITIIT